MTMQIESTRTRVMDWLADHPKGEAFNLVRDIWQMVLAQEARDRDEWPDAVYAAAEKALKPHVEEIPFSCDGHARHYVREDHGEEYCGACFDDGFSGELSRVGADTVAIETIKAIRKALGHAR